jgi:hypothetical protein
MKSYSARYTNGQRRIIRAKHSKQAWIIAQSVGAGYGWTVKEVGTI